MPMQPDRYPPDWPERAQRIKERDGWTCRHCGARHDELGAHDDTGHWWAEDQLQADPAMVELLFGTVVVQTVQMKRVVVTVAHLDHDETNWLVSDDRLLTLCAACHLRYDADDNARRRKYGRNYRDNQLNLGF